MATKRQQRSEVMKRQKQSHLLNVVYKLVDQGSRDLTARQIAEASMYGFSCHLVNELFDMVEDGKLDMEVYSYRTKGPCTHKYTFRLPRQSGRKSPKKQSPVETD